MGWFRRNTAPKPVAVEAAPRPPVDAFISWDAYPAAGRITITGRRMTGPTVKLTGIRAMSPSGDRGYVVAIDKEGARHFLAV